MGGILESSNGGDGAAIASPSATHQESQESPHNEPQQPGSSAASDKKKIVDQQWFCTILQNGSRTDPHGTLRPELYYAIRDKLSVLDVPPDSTLDIWLESPGGSATIAYKLNLLFRDKFARIRAVIPDYAKSAATLLAIGCDEIWMAAAAELGPLDVQIEHPDREHVTISGLDESRALGFLADFALDLIVIGGLSVYTSTELPRREVIREVSRFASRLIEPSIAKLDPQLIHRAAQDLELATRYAARMLASRQCEDEEKEINAIQLASHLVEAYPAHEYLISRAEARSLKLPIRNLEDYPQKLPLLATHLAFEMNEFGSHHVDLWPASALADKIKAIMNNEEDGNESEEQPKTHD